eukprot:CAMPEP_0115598392 /NCGR_PEP_ID=MMETSP0272-20121206/13853_1 /TAXON_ID=71861 /ORGANISM="Scrippsiella trochoidea, Strain CCMP3099" /LENGTH=73 /DNA_ID=CAMNT_0003033811 /DNA_START=453 /DNA_END=670 /DNA_ORIENTATION=-
MLRTSRISDESCANLQSRLLQYPRSVMKWHNVVLVRSGLMRNSLSPCANLQDILVQHPCRKSSHNSVLKSWAS